MKFQRILSVLSAAALAAALCAPAAAARFSDTEDHPAQSAIDEFSTLKILEGDGQGHFFPDLPITRGDLCTILDRVFTYTDTVPNTFPDLDENTWYAGPMLKLNAAGIILGDGAGIRPLDTIRWDEALVMIARAFGLAELPDGEVPVALDDWARGYIAAMWSAGYLPTGGFDPAAPFTRADTVTILDNVIDDLGWAAAGKIKAFGKLVPILEDVPVYSLNNDAFYMENGRLRYDDGVTPVAYGIDVSRYQETIDWPAVAADGIDFAMIRLGFRGYGSAGTLNVDKYFEENLAGAVEAGLDVGIYLFSQAITVEEAVAEAKFVLEHLNGRPLTYPIVFDWEPISNVGARTDGLDDATLTACAIAFCDTIAAAGYQPMVYFNNYLGLLHYDLSALTDYPFWYALYNTKGITPTIYYDFRMWQYSDHGTVAGIEGGVDMNICFHPFGAAHGSKGADENDGPEEPAPLPVEGETIPTPPWPEEPSAGTLEGVDVQPPEN